MDSTTGKVVGNDRGEFYILYPENLENLAIFAPDNYNGVLSFTITTVAVENDGDLATSATVPFTVTFLPHDDSPIPPGIPPQPPNITIGDPDDRPSLPPNTQNPTSSPTLMPTDPDDPGGPSTGPPAPGPIPTSAPTLPSGTTASPTQAATIVIDVNTFNVGIEDQPLILDIDVGVGAGETTDPIITITLSDIPENFTITGAVFNPLTGTYSASPEDFRAGRVQLVPSEDFNGPFELTVDVTVSAGFTTASESLTLTGFFDPVADGVGISFSPESAFEDELISASIDYEFRNKVDSEEVFGGFVYMTIDEEATIPYPIVGVGDPDETVLGVSMVGFYRIPVNQANNFQIQLEEDWHGRLSGQIIVPVAEKFDDNDGDNAVLSREYVHWFPIFIFLENLSHFLFS